jgi:hypothetical protein
MMKLIRIENDYILIEGEFEKVDDTQEVTTFTAPLLGATMKIDGAEKLLLIDFDNIDPFILNDESSDDWEVELDLDFRIYLKTQTI